MKAVLSPQCLLCTALALTAVPALADGTGFSGDVGLGLTRSQSILHGGQTTASPFPLLAFDYGRFFARIDTFGVKVVPVASGHLEVLTRYRADGYSVDGLSHRGNPVPLGLGTLQVTPVGAFELSVLRDFSDSAGTFGQARYLLKLPAGRVSLYPELGVEYLNRRYASYYYGTQGDDVLTTGRAWAASNATNVFAGAMLRVELGGKFAAYAYVRRTWYDDTIGNSPLVKRGARNNGFVALARSF